MDNTILSALIAAGGVLLTVLITYHTWRRDNERNHAREQQISTALYINPFIDACEQLQSRIYNVFKKHGLAALSLHYKEDRHAGEMLFQLSRYFGWERIIRRYASHVLDQPTMDLLEELRETFSHDGDGKWRFYREEQKTLGQFAVRRVTDTEREFEEVPFHIFETELKAGTLADMTSAREAIQAICTAKVNAEQIDGKARLIKAQGILVAILNRMEKAVNYSVFKGIRETLQDGQ